MSQVDATGEPSERGQSDEPEEPILLLEQLNATQNELEEALEAMGADPQQDWLAQARPLRELKSRWDMLHQHARCIADAEPHVLLSVEGASRDQLHDWLGNHAAWMAGELAVRFGHAGQPRERAQLLSKGAAIATEEMLAAELVAAEREPQTHAALIYARWLHRNQRFDEAEKVLTTARRAAEQEVLREALDEVLNAPRPLSSAPGMGTINGIGAMLYGERDRHDDGSYVTTLFFTVLFMPVLPLAAYRVEREGDGYLFHGRVPLSPLTRWWRRLAAAAVVLSLVGGGAYAYFGGDSFRAGRAVAAAQEQENAGDTAAALQGYQEVLAEYDKTEEPPTGALEDAGLGIVRIAAAGMPDPPAPGDVSKIEGVVGAYDSLPGNANRSAKSWLAARLLKWAKALGGSDLPHARAAVEVLDMAAEIIEQRDQVAAEQQSAHLALARALRKEAPLAALSHYDVALDEPGAMDEAMAIIERFGEAPSLWVWHAGEVERWAARARAGDQTPERKEQSKRMLAKQAEAKKQHQDNRKLIGDNDAAKLAAAFEAQPKTQELAVAVAEAELAEGRPDKAVALLKGLGDPGMLTPDTRLALAGFERNNGDLASAERHYEAIVSQRLPLYKSATRRYRRAYEQAMRAQWDKLANGSPVRALEDKLNGLGQDAQQQVVFEWIQNEVDRDPSLQRLRERMLSLHDVVAATIALGSIKLQRARAASGDDKRRLLREAEQSMLSMQASAQGLPSYHLSLGEVYHRLSRSDEGDRELAALLKRNDTMLTLAVGHVYRNLGGHKRARGIFEQAYQNAKDERQRFEAAHARSLTSRDLEDQLLWLERSDKSQPAIQASLAVVAGQRALERGDIGEADRQHAEAARLRMTAAEHNAAAANNAALALITRYSLTGDRKYVAKATKLLEQALQLSSSDPLVMGNLAVQLRYHGALEVLAGELDVDMLAPGHGDADAILHTLLSSSRAASVRQALGKSRKLKRSLELLRQQQALAPQNPQPYLSELLIIGEQRDAKAARQLLERLGGLPSLRIDDIAEQRRDYEAGKMDDLMRRRLKAGLLLAARAKESATRSGSKQTAAMALVMVSLKHNQMTVLDGSEAAKKALIAARKAAELWAEPATEIILANALFDVARYGAAERSPVLQAALQSDGRQFGVDNATIIAAQSANKEEVLSSLSAQPQLKEALALSVKVAERLGNPAPLWAYHAAGWLGDDDAQRRLPPPASNPVLALNLQVQELIYVGEEREKLDRKHWLAIEQR